jgi:excisionase family DNA binding protein
MDGIGKRYRSRGLAMKAEEIIPMSRAALMCGLKPLTLRRYVAAGKVAAIRVGRVRRVRLSAVRSFLQEIPTA